MEVRNLDVSDISEFKAIRVECVSDAPLSFRASPEEVSTKAHKDFERELCGNMERDFFVGAFIGGKLVGVAALYHQSHAKMLHKAELGSVYVKPEYRNRGVARELALDIIGKVKRDGVVKYIKLSVSTHNEAAIKVYKGLGFSIYGTEPGVVYLDGRYHDEYLMQIAL